MTICDERASVTLSLSSTIPNEHHIILCCRVQNSSQTLDISEQINT